MQTLPRMQQGFALCEVFSQAVPSSSRYRLALTHTWNGHSQIVALSKSETTSLPLPEKRKAKSFPNTPLTSFKKLVFLCFYSIISPCILILIASYVNAYGVQTGSFYERKINVMQVADLALKGLREAINYVDSSLH